MRLERAAQYARAHGFNWFTTTLSISPVKDPVRLNTIGCELAQQYGLNYLQSEFRKKDGYKRSLALSAEYACTGRITAAAFQQARSAAFVAKF